MDIHAVTGLISEILTWIGLLGGSALYLAGLSVRGISGRWVAADGVVAASGTGTVFRWFDGDGDVHELPADTDETHELTPGEDVPLWFHARRPWRARTHAPELDGKALRLMGVILLGTGVVAGVLGIVLMFVEP